MSDLVSRSWNGTPISRRTTDGYVNATAMAKASGKQWSDYFRTDRATTYMEALSRNCEIPVTSLYISKPGEGTWIHPRLAVDFARWIAAEFAVWMDAWFLEEINRASQVRDTQAPQLTPEQQGLEWLMSWGQRWGIKYDERDQLQMKQYAMSLALPPAGGTQSIYNDYPLSRLIFEQFQTTLPLGKLIKIGKLLSRLHRQWFNEEPPKHDQYVDGANRSVAHYPREWAIERLKELHDEDPSLFQRK